MFSERDTYRAAHLLIDRHRDDAEFRAAERIDKLMDEGDLDGVVTGRAIEELRRGRRSDESVN